MSAQSKQRPGLAYPNSDSGLAGNSCPEPANLTGRASGFQWKTRTSFLGFPLICVAYGRGEKGRPMVAKGLVAIGQFAVGGVAIGQFGVGLIGIGQFAVGLLALGQLALSPLVGFGQVAVGTFAIGQFVVGKFARGQFGWAEDTYGRQRGPTWRPLPCLRPLNGSCNRILPLSGRT